MKCANRDRNYMLQHLIESMPIDEYEGYTLKEIHYLIYDPYCNNSPMVLSETIDAEVFIKIPFINLVKYFLDLVEQTQPIKVNANGFLPLKIIQPVSDQHFIIEDFEDVREIRIVRHSKSLAVRNVKIITDLAGLTKTRKHEFTLTQKGEKYKSNLYSSKLFAEVIKTYTTKFKWSFNDSFGSNNIGQFGFAYMLNLISKYGNLPRNFKFYIDKYYKAFSSILVNSDENEFHQDLFQRCFILRTFIRFLNWFGLINIIDEMNTSREEYTIEKSDIFDALIRFD